MKGKVIIAGAGPGAVDLITLRTKYALESADLIIYAGSLVNPEILDFAKEKTRKINSAQLSLDEVVAIVNVAVADGKKVVRLHTGDPAMYGAISEQMNEFEKLNIDYEVIPGVSSVFAAAAELKTELTMPGITQSVILTRRAGRTPVPLDESIVKLAPNNATLAMFLSISDIKGLVKDLINAGRPLDTPIAVVYRATWKNQVIVKGCLTDIAEKVNNAGIKRQAMVIIGKVLNRDGDLSLLYDKTFAHGYRKTDIKNEFKGDVAIYALTEKGCAKAGEIHNALGKSKVFIPERFEGKYTMYNSFGYGKINDLLAENWKKFDAHLFIMAAGIVVRKIAGLLEGKTIDPAVVVCDELGNNSISLLSGHIGGANRLAKFVAGVTGGNSVITTATDVHKIMAFDEMAAIKKWKIKNPEKIKYLNSMLLERKNIDVLIPEGIFNKYYKDCKNIRLISKLSEISGDGAVLLNKKSVDTDIPVLEFTNKKYVIGIGCKKDTTDEEINTAVEKAIAKLDIGFEDIAFLATSDVKKNEAGLHKFASVNSIFLKFITKEDLNSIQTPNSSPKAKEEFGINSVAEASAIFTSRHGKLIFEKHKYSKVTIAVAILNSEDN
ncbi:MAG: precorrin-4 C(11)-methyltransferase [bacterium]|nr:precorrin-4 C(11)-methyltransferase [bacterium]